MGKINRVPLAALCVVFDDGYRDRGQLLCVAIFITRDHWLAKPVSAALRRWLLVGRPSEYVVLFATLHLRNLEIGGRCFGTLPLGNFGARGGEMMRAP